MIPLRDHLPGRTTPIVVFILIALNVLVFFYESNLTQGRLEAFVESYGMIPYEITRGKDIPPAGPEPLYATLISSMFMHGSWLHLGGNMLYLWIFGNNVEDVFGKIGFLIFYLGVGLAGHLGQIFLDPASQVPLIGASGAIAGVMGAYLAFFPRARVDTILLVFYFVRIVALPAIYVLGFWIVIQFIQAFYEMGGAGGGVAWWAHIGGFAAGFLIGLLFRRRATAQRGYDAYG